MPSHATSAVKNTSGSIEVIKSENTNVPKKVGIALLTAMSLSRRLCDSVCQIELVFVCITHSSLHSHMQCGIA